MISHPQALAQCNSYLKSSKLHSEAAYDTAGSAKLIAEGGLKGVGAICSELAAEHFGLEVLEKGPAPTAPRGRVRHRGRPQQLHALHPLEGPSREHPARRALQDLDRLLLGQHRRPLGRPLSRWQAGLGALFKALSVFALRDVDLSKIESRPCKTER